MSVPSAAESGRPTEATIRVGDVDVHVAGDGARTLLMVHGWPDTWRLWDAQVAALAGRYRCVRFSLPGFEPGAPVRGHSLAEITQALAAIADAVSPSAPVVLMVHDWGCLFGYEFSRAHPDRVERIIGLDIGDAGSRAHRDSITAGQMAMIFGYQAWLALAWRIGGAIGDRMTRAMARWLRAPGTPETIGARMNYPYDMAWTGSHGGLRSARGPDPVVPMLYVYGQRKPFMFHSPSWLEALARRQGSRVLALDTGHWLMVRRPDALNAAIIEWLGADDAAGTRLASDQ